MEAKIKVCNIRQTLFLYSVFRFSSFFSNKAPLIMKKSGTENLQNTDKANASQYLRPPTGSFEKSKNPGSK